MPRSYVRMFGRLSLFVIYFWFGLLKLIGQSPASELVLTLYKKMPLLSSIPFSQFYIAFAVFEMLIGVLFLLPRFNKFAFLLFIAHMAMTALPLFVLPHLAWTAFLVPTFEGQYIIKNVALISVMLFLATGRRY